MSVIKTALDRIFTKAEAVSGGYVASPGQAQFTDREDYERIIHEAYNKNPFFYAGTNLISDVFADLDYVVEDAGEEQEDHPLAILLDSPNDDQGGTEFRKEQALFYLLSGKCFTHMPNASDSGKVIMLNNIVPKYVEVISGGRLSPIGSFKVQSGSDGKVPIPKDEMIYVKNFHPFHKWDAHPPIMSAATTVDLNNAQLEWNLSLLQNRGTPAHVFTGFASQDEARNWKEVNERTTQGFRNAGKDLYLGDISVTKLGFSAQEMDWLEGYRQTGRNILMLLGVSSDLMNDGANKTYNNYETSIKALVYQTVLPMARLFCDAYNLRLAPYFGDNVKVSIDVNSIEALQDNLKERIEAGKIFYESNLGNRGEARNIAGMPKEVSNDGDTQEVIPSNQIPLR